MKFWNLFYEARNFWKITSVLFWVKRKSGAKAWQAETHSLHNFWTSSISTSGNTENAALEKFVFQCFCDSIQRLQYRKWKYGTRCVRSLNLRRIGRITRKIQPFETSWQVANNPCRALRYRVFMKMVHPPTHIIRAHGSTCPWGHAKLIQYHASGRSCSQEAETRGSSCQTWTTDPLCL